MVGLSQRGFPESRIKKDLESIKDIEASEQFRNCVRFGDGKPGADRRPVFVKDRVDLEQSKRVDCAPNASHRKGWCFFESKSKQVGH